MQRYHLQGIVGNALSFLDDLTNTYIRLNRSRFWQDGMHQDKLEAYSCLYDSDSVFNIDGAFAPF